jgi:ribonuclease HI
MTSRGAVGRGIQEKLTVSRVAREGGGGGGAAGGGGKGGNGGGSSRNARTQAEDGIAFVDGSVNQGAAGIGIWYGAGHRLNFASSIPDAAADNNVTELIAIFMVLLRHPRHARLAIHTDSRACMTTIEGLASGAAVGSFKPSTPAYRSLLRALRWVLFWRSGRTVLHKIKAHSGQTPNERADQLAALGANSEFASTVPGYGLSGQGEGNKLSRGLFPGALWGDLIRFLAGEEGVGTGAIGGDHEAFTRKKTAADKRTSPYSHYKGPLATPVPLDSNKARGVHLRAARPLLLSHTHYKPTSLHHTTPCIVNLFKRPPWGK